MVSCLSGVPGSFQVRAVTAGYTVGLSGTVRVEAQEKSQKRSPVLTSGFGALVSLTSGRDRKRGSCARLPCAPRPLAPQKTSAGVAASDTHSLTRALIVRRGVLYSEYLPHLSSSLGVR